MKAPVPVPALPTERVASVSDGPLWKTAQEWLRPALLPDSLAIDGTCGNGGDTLFLCESLGPRGTVIGLDIQPEAIRATGDRLSDHGLSATLLREDHSRLGFLLMERGVLQVDAAIFNLGYLPGGDHSVTTDPASACRAMDAILRRASDRFRLSVVAYQGHPGGKQETVAVRSFLKNTESTGFQLVEKGSRDPERGPVFFGVKRLQPEVKE